jgi:SAM-dependent methyltransferase
VSALRAAYAEALARGTGPFFEARRTACYVCGAEALKPHRRFADFWQRKPGRFELERCTACGHLQQNPPLSGEGLAFYYRDFYDGLGTEALELILGMNPAVHLARARFVTGSPRRWLDVGGGYGHFCAAARRVWTETRFECLDMGASVEEAVRRGWAHEGHRGQLSELAPKLEGKYDVVSMSHYLEHTRDPRADLTAAFRVLAPGGRLFIEVPDPECLWRLGLGPFWAPYLQPQHQHLLSVKNLSGLLAERGFDVERVERGDAKLGDDATLACLLLVKFLAPEDSPWRPPADGVHALKAFAVPFLATPLFAVAWLVDRITRRLRHLPGGSNAYRVLARKRWTQEQAA